MAAKKFRQDPTIEVALLSLMAAGVGLDFSAATAVAFVGATAGPELQGNDA